MLHSSRKILVVALMLFAFIGQALAYTPISFSMSNDMHSQHMSMNSSDNEMMDHGQMSMPMSAQTGDCCDLDCSCPASGCVSFPFLSADIFPSRINSAIDKIHYSDSTLLSSDHKSLYRPPIFA